jgi:hypothetical protein
MTLQPRPQQNPVDIFGRLRSMLKEYRGAVASARHRDKLNSAYLPFSGTGERKGE